MLKELTIVQENYIILMGEQQHVFPWQSGTAIWYCPMCMYRVFIFYVTVVPNKLSTFLSKCILRVMTTTDAGTTTSALVIYRNKLALRSNQNLYVNNVKVVP